MAELVDDVRHALFVAGDGAGAQNDEVAFADDQLVSRTGHAVKPAHGLPLAAGGDDADLGGLVALEVVDVNNAAVGDLQIPKLDGQFGDVLHAPSLEADLAVVRDGAVDDLLDAVDVGSEGGDDDAPLRAVKIPPHSFSYLGFRHGVARQLGVGAVRHQAEHAVFSVFGQTCQIGRCAVYGGVVDLKVAGVDEHARRRGNGKRHGSGNGVVDMDELHAHAAELDDVARLYFTQLGVGNTVLFQFVVDERERQLAAIYRDRKLFERVGNGADVVFVPVGDHKTADAAGVFFQVLHVGNDEVDAGHVVGGENRTAVDHKNIFAVFDDRHVLPDLIDSAQGDDF